MRCCEIICQGIHKNGLESSPYLYIAYGRRSLMLYIRKKNVNKTLTRRTSDRRSPLGEAMINGFLPILLLGDDPWTAQVSPFRLTTRLLS